MNAKSKNRWQFSSESVTEGHPDKVCDQISDAVLDAILREDPQARVACETVANTGMIMVFGEISTECYVDIQEIVRQTLRDIGYTRAKYGFDSETCSVLVALKEQSPDISQAVSQSLEAKQGDTEANAQTGAGDQGMMFGYASNETAERMPLPISLAHSLCKKLAEVRKSGLLPLLRPDGKAQVTVEYEGNTPLYVSTIVVSTQHDPKYTLDAITADITREVIEAVIPDDLLRDETRVLVNPSGRFEIGGPQADAGLTGRKIIVDTYGGMASHGGGAFSGKDPTKVDRSASYAARHVAKNIVAAGLADRCQVQLAYSIGVAHPVSIHIDTFDTGVISDSELAEIVRTEFLLTPDGIIEKFDLRRPLYNQVAKYGHFGRPELDLPWEKEDMVDTLKQYLPHA